ncbi:hypothetical protein KC19_10G123300 [Ceratodon purpureus]|uniref:FHA domain-containing protein n=1 Tax=Ceratodon purpureus TaxID=3225 RepID=A0A8T0GM87_CERPU|nr:hypothetical protein KC19_10G123300 [Ceratodon purpureus]
MDSLAQGGSDGDGGGGGGGGGVEMSRGEVKNGDQRDEFGGGEINPNGMMSGSVEGGAGLPKVPVFKEPRAMGPPSLFKEPKSIGASSSFKEPKAMGPPSSSKEVKPMGPPSLMPPPSMPPPSMPPPSMPPPSMPPPSMPPPKISKANLPGPMGPPPVRVKQSKEEVKEPVEGSASEARSESSSDVKAPGEEGDGAAAAVQAPKIKWIGPGAVPYVKPAWSAPPGHPFKLEVLKEGVIVSNFDVSEKGAYMFGRSDRCDFMLEHPTVSRYHAVLQYNDKGEAFIYDLGSTHGTFVNKRQVKANNYTPLHVGAVVRFGLSTRLYVLQGPSELMPEEGPSLKVRLESGGAVSAAEAAHMREMSLRRAKAEAAALEGASWGMQEDAEVEEEEEEDLDEVTWQTHRGPLTDKQQKTLEKVQKRHEKMANLNKEIDAIRAKEGSQGGLTQGQQTQVARNEQRIEALMEELESMEETLNESIRESLGARSGKSISKKKPVFEDEEDENDSDDEFYDRTNKRKQKGKIGEPVQVVETAETLLEKRDVIAKEMDVVSAELKAEEAKSATKEESSVTSESIDPLDAFMSSVSTNIVKDKASRLSKELSKLQAEADRIARLLKIADPSGDAARKWDGKAEDSNQSQKVETIVENRLRLRASKEAARELASQAKEVLDSAPEEIAAPATGDVSMDSTDEKVEAKEMPILAPTLLLGAPRPAPRPDVPESETTKSSTPMEQDTESGNEFVGYKDRKRPVSKEDVVQVEDVTGDKLGSEDRDVASNAAMEAVALLMRHKSGLTAQEELQEQESRSGNNTQHSAGTKTRGKKKRKLGPERPPMLAKESDELEEAWVPPQGQTGDGRTALNDKLGY